VQHLSPQRPLQTPEADEQVFCVHMQKHRMRGVEGLRRGRASVYILVHGHSGLPKSRCMLAPDEDALRWGADCFVQALHTILWTYKSLLTSLHDISIFNAPLVIFGCPPTCSTREQHVDVVFNGIVVAATLAHFTRHLAFSLSASEFGGNALSTEPYFPGIFP